MKPINLHADYLSSHEASDMLGISKRTLHRWVRLRKGPPWIKVGRFVYFRKEAISLWLLSLEACNSVATPQRKA